MHEPENPLARWSRLKREARRDSTAERADAAVESFVEPRAAAADARPADSAAVKPEFDPATLPPIESITADTDIKAFLQSGVPAALTRAALRRVWATDPAIRDFIEVAENQWDFANPSAIPGFGPLQPGDDVGQLVSRAMGQLGDTLQRDAAADAAATPATPTPASLQRDTHVPQPEQAASDIQASGVPDGNRGETEVAEQPEAVIRADVAVQDCGGPAKGGAAPNRRSHGRALPQ